MYMNKLTPYEHHEIFNYPQIYFIGANAKKRPGIIGGPNNCGYDDDQVRKDGDVFDRPLFFHEFERFLWITMRKIWCVLLADRLVGTVSRARQQVPVPVPKGPVPP